MYKPSAFKIAVATRLTVVSSMIKVCLRTLIGVSQSRDVTWINVRETVFVSGSNLRFSYTFGGVSRASDIARPD